ncbi:MAG: DCC1-like thiol-disulfide oxidoreductase family protein [Actinomycetota bacterium]
MTALDDETDVEPPVRRLTVMYDETCARCRRWARWLEERRCRVTVELLPAGSAQARARYPRVAPWLGRELVVVDNAARAWIGPPAFLVALWATASYRWVASFASRPWVWPVAKRYLRRLSDRRLHCDPDADCDTPLDEFLGFTSQRA